MSPVLCTAMMAAQADAITIKASGNARRVTLSPSPKMSVQGDDEQAEEVGDCIDEAAGDRKLGAMTGHRLLLLGIRIRRDHRNNRRGRNPCQGLRHQDMQRAINILAKDQSFPNGVDEDLRHLAFDIVNGWSQYRGGGEGGNSTTSSPVESSLSAPVQHLRCGYVFLGLSVAFAQNSSEAVVARSETSSLSVSRSTGTCTASAMGVSEGSSVVFPRLRSSSLG